LSINIEQQSALIESEVAHLRESQRWTESQYRILIVASLIASAVTGSLGRSESLLLVLVLPLLSALLLGFWAYGEARYRQAEDRAVSLLLNLERRGTDWAEERSRILDEDISAYLDSWIRTRSKVTSIERSGYGIVIMAELAVVLARLMGF
jgi:hypothetical protein